MLADFVASPASQTAQLAEAHVLALRLYSTAAFHSLNAPLRDKQRTGSHPYAATVFFLADGIKKLRAVEAARAEAARDKRAEDADGSLDLWRGMRNRGAADKFLKLGGTEPALMSTTSDLAIAVQYGLSSHSLLFKLRTTSFMTRGADSARAGPDHSPYAP